MATRRAGDSRAGTRQESPPRTMLDELGQMKTLEQVAERIQSTWCCRRCVPSAPMQCRARGIRAPGSCWSVKGRGPRRMRPGRPFVGAAGGLLDSILEAIEVAARISLHHQHREVPPPGNRKPLPDEIAPCIPYLAGSSRIIRPRVITRPRQHGGRVDPGREEESERAPQQGPQLQRDPPGGDVPSGCAAAQPQLEEVDLG